MMRNIFTGAAGQGPGGGAVFRTGGIELAAGSYKERAGHACVRPEDIAIVPESPSGSACNAFTGTITRIAGKGLNLYVTVSVPPDFCCLVNKSDMIGMGLKEGNQVRISFRKDAVHLF